MMAEIFQFPDLWRRIINESIRPTLDALSLSEKCKSCIEAETYRILKLIEDGPAPTRVSFNLPESFKQNPETQKVVQQIFDAGGNSALERVGPALFQIPGLIARIALLQEELEEFKSSGE